MKKAHVFDVLVVYTHAVATSAAEKEKQPFSKKSGRFHYNVSYAYFLEVCRKNGLRAAFTTTEDIRADGFCESYWEYKNSKWLKSKGLCFAPLVFDKFSPLSKLASLEQTLFFTDTGVLPFNDTYLHGLFDDKLMTYNTLTGYTIPTVDLLNSNPTIIKAAIQKLSLMLKKHTQGKDFSSDFVLKDRFGAGGIDIYKIDSDKTASIEKLMNKNGKTSFILQPFLNFQDGFDLKDFQGAKDLRLIFCNGKLVQQYVRRAKEGDFRCNAHQGGTVRYIKKSEIPAAVIDFAGTVITKLDHAASIYALDFIISDNKNVYFLEGNINPGVYWEKGSVEDEAMTRELIHIIVKECLRRTDFEANVLVALANDVSVPQVKPLPLLTN